MSPLPPGTRIRILASAKTGHVVPCLGVSRALGIEPEIVPVRPRKLFHLLAPWGPADPADAGVSAPYPDIAIASGRETVPCLRKLKRVSNGRVFTIYLGDPRVSRNVFDLIWTPEHDDVSGANVVKTVTAPHPHSQDMLRAARAICDVRMAGLTAPKVACLIGGPSGQYRFGPGDVDRLCAAIAAILAQGGAVMISPSRRTPQEAIQRIGQTIGDVRAQDRAFVWDGTGDNPYVRMLAQADAFLLTSDSVNMIGEVLATGKPVHVLRLDGKAGKFANFYENLRAGGFIRYWNGTLEHWSYEPLDATAQIAADVVKRYSDFRAAK